MKKYIIDFIIVLLIAVTAISSIYFIKLLSNQQKQIETFKKLEYISTSSEKDNFEEKNIVLLSKVYDEYNKNTDSTQEKPDLNKLFKINSDIIGWIKIEETNINYPVMQNDDFYIDKDFYKNYSKSGTPFLASYCNVVKSDNLIIYGHHMKNGTMFANLENYKNENFYRNHKFIKFYYLEEEKTIENIYEIIYVFKTVAYADDGFKYYAFYKAKNENEFNSFISECSKLKLYDTEATANYKDKLLTLSTCEYSQKNGRLIIVAKKIS